MKRAFKRALSLMLALAMALTCIPAEVVRAANEDQQEDHQELIFEAEAAYKTFAGSWSEVTREKGAGSEGHGKFTFAQAYANEGQTVTFILPVAEEGTYELYVTTKDNPDRAIFQFSMDGTHVGEPVDLYSSNSDGEFAEHKIGTARLEVGDHALTATLAGRNENNTGRCYGGAFDYFRLVKIQDGEEKPEAVDKTALENAIADSASYAEKDYTAESWAVFSAALKGAQDVFAEESSDKEAVEAALAALNAAIAALVGTDDETGDETDNTGKILYENRFETLPEELSGVSGWELVQLKDNGYALKGTSPAGAGLLAQFTKGVTLPEKYTIVVDMAMLRATGINGYSAGMTFQHTDGSHFYHFRLDNGTGKTAQLYRWNGGAAKLGQKETPISDGEAFRLRITVDGTTITGYVDGEEMVTYSGAATGGSVGLRVYNAEALFDNLVVYEGVVAPDANEKAGDFILAGNDPVIWNNEDSGYTEASGAWSELAGAGQDGSNARTAAGGSVNFSNYAPATGNFEVEWFVPAADGAAADVTIQTLDGTWKYAIPANTSQGWYRLGVVSGTESTAFTVTVGSAGKLYVDAVRLTPTNLKADAPYSPTEGGSDAVAVLVNQIGYDNGTSMRATVPNAADGTPFQVINADTKAVAYEGTVQGNIADFTGKITTDKDTDFYITCASAQSYDFTIGENLIYRRSVENALKFMAETRSDTFCVGKAGFGWRDSHQFSFELNGLVLQYMANPSLYDNMDYQIYKVDTCEYEELRVQDEPALVWLIQFAALRYYHWGAEKGGNLHALIKEQLAYYLYLYPEISEYVSEETYQKIRDYTISVWGDNKGVSYQWYPVTGTNHNLYALQTVFAGLKGSQPPGHSIVPNLMMYEVALRDGLGDDVANKFFQAAYENCAYLISDEFDLNDPFYNKGQRMSEYITIPALAYFLEMYPDKAPAGLKAAIQEWTKVTIARSENMWDIRMAVSLAAGDGKYTFHNPNYTAEQKVITKDYWTGAAYANADNQAGYLAGGAPKNEPGNQGGLQAVTYAAARVLGGTSESDRLKALGVAAIDDLFGRNPSGRAAFYHFTRDFEGADLGWYKQYVGGNGLLGGHTAVIDANAPEGCYPYNPEAYNTGYTEGWVAYNTAWNASLAYAAADAVKLQVSKTSGNQGEEITITLTAPINMDTTKQETGEVIVTTSTGERIAVAVTENGTDSTVFTGSYTLPDVPYVTVSYGSGLFEHSYEVTVQDFEGTPVTGIVLEDILNLGAGETVRLNVTVLPAEATDKRVSFVSSNPAVVTVSKDGVVTAVGAGEAAITVTSDSAPGVSAVCQVNVSAAAPTGLKLEAPESVSVFGSGAKVKVIVVTYSDGSESTENLPLAVSFASDKETVLTVGVDGTIKPIAAGEATITTTAVVEGKEITGTVKVAVTAETTYDFLALYRAGSYTADDGTKLAIAANTKDELTTTYGTDRLKLTGGAKGNEISFDLGGLAAGEYEVTLYTKFYGGSWAYGVWSLKMDGETLLDSLDFDNEEKNGTYHNIDLGTVTLTGNQAHSFTFVSEDGGSVVPVSVTLNKVGGTVDPEPSENWPDQTQKGKQITDISEMYEMVYKGMNYRLYVPADYTPDQTDKTPMMIYLNGAGSRGTDNKTQLKNLSPLITPFIKNKNYPSCIIVVPQLPTSDKWVNVDWAKGCYDKNVAESDSAGLLMELISELKKGYKIDEDRVYLMGQSFGGYGTWDLITRHPETFAAAVPMCGAGCLERAEAIKDMPLLVLHGDSDPSVPVAGSREMVAAVKEAGNTSITYIEYPGDDHYIQRRIFEQPELYLTWMFNQKKGQTPEAPDVSSCYMPKMTLNLNSASLLNRLSVTGGTAAISGEQMTVMPADSKSSVLALVKNTDAYKDGVLTAHITMDALTGSGGAGLVLRAQDDKNYIHLRFTKDGLNLLEMIGGQAKRNDFKPYTLTGNQITCMKAEVIGNKLKVWIDNVEIYNTTIQNAQLQTKGMVGIRSYAVPAKVDDIIWAEKSSAAPLEPSVALTSLHDRQVIQRNVAAENGQVQIAGSVDNVKSLKARIVAWEDSTKIVKDWFDVKLTEGRFDTSVTLPQGGWYKLELKAEGEDGQTAEAASGRFGIGINILCIGQSNMVGIGQGTPTAADDRASNFMNETWSHLEDPYAKGDATSISNNGSNCGNSMTPALANALIEKYNVPVGIIPAAKSGAGLVCDCKAYPRWLDRNDSNPFDRSNLYGNSLFRARAAGGIEFILMNQGEHDVSGNTSEEAYLSALWTLVDNYRKDLGFDVPFLYCQLGAAKPGSWTEAAKDDIMDGIRSAQIRFNNPANGILMAAVESDLTRNSDNLHYTTESQNIIGKRVATAIFWYYDENPEKADYYTGPTITGVQFTDDTRKTIDVTIAHGGGTDFAPASNITGFVVKDGDTEVTVTSAVRKDADTITLILDRAITGTATLRYLKGLLPNVTGIVKDNSTMQLPLNATPGWLTVKEAAEDPGKADAEAAAKVDKAIEEIGTITKDSVDAIRNARDAYDALTENQKKLVTKLPELVAAEKAYQKLLENSKLTKPDTNTGNGVGKHEHTGGVWVSDGNSHWHVCTACGEITEKGLHTVDGQGICTICSKVLGTTAAAAAENTAASTAVTAGTRTANRNQASQALDRVNTPEPEASAPDASVEDEEQNGPLTEPTEPAAEEQAGEEPWQIEEDAVPLASEAQGSWALLNLLLMLLTAAAGVVITVSGVRREEDEKRRRVLWICSLLPAVASATVFLLMENFGAPMRFVNVRTLWMALFAVVQIALVVLSHRNEEAVQIKK